MKHYYIMDSTEAKGFREVTETEFNEFRIFRSEVSTYAEQVTNGEITIDDVPETHKSAVEEKLAPTVEEKAAAYDILMGNEVSE